MPATLTEAPEGTVVAVGPESVTVRVDATVHCTRCAAGRGCGAAVFATGDAGRQIEVQRPPGCTLATGDRVRLSLSPARLLHAAWLAYGVPLTAMLTAAVGAAALLPAPVGDGMLLATAAAGLLLGVCWARRRMRHNACLRRFLPSLEPDLPSGP